MGELLPEVVQLQDGRGGRPPNAAGIGVFWYEPEIWQLPLSPAARVLYAGLCSYLGHREINRKDLRNTLKDSTDEEIAEAFKELVRHNLFVPSKSVPPGYRVNSVGVFRARP